MRITKIGFDVNEYTILFFILLVFIVLIVVYYSLLTHILEKKIKELQKEKKHKHKIKHIRKTRKN